MASEIGADRPAHERRRQDAYRVIFECAEDPILIHDPDTGGILEANPKACALLGYSQEQLRQLSVEDFSAGPGPYDQAHALALIHAARFRPQRAEWPVRAGDGQLVWHEVVLRLIRLNGRDRILAVGRDISDRKAKNAARQQLENQLRQAHKLEAIGAVSGGIATDFERILTAISGNLALASRRAQRLDDSELDEWLRDAAHIADQGRVLIDRLLTYSRGQRGDCANIQLAPIVRQAVDELRQRFSDEVELQFDLPRGLPSVRFNPVQAGQLISNLIVNAADSLDRKGRISFSLEAVNCATRICSSCNRLIEGAFLIFRVSDTGRGIDRDSLQRVFDPFFTTHTSGKNSGLGLSIVHGLVHEHGGHVVINSVAGVGTEVEVFFPMPAAGPGGKRDTRQLQGRVAIVGDPLRSSEISELLGDWGLQTRVLPAQEGAGKQALDRCGPFDFVVVDLEHEQNQAPLSRQFEEFGDEIPLLVCASDTRQDVIIGDNRQVAVLRKPIDADKLRMYVEALLGHPE